MKLTDDLPKWIARPLRLVLYAFVMYILFNIALGVIKGRIAINTVECSGMIHSASDGLEYARGVVACLKKENGYLENLVLRPVFRAVETLPNAPKEYVGIWHASQPRCNYQHKLEEDGRFTSEPLGCSLSSETFHGTWGVYDNQMIWLVDGEGMWPPDINPIDRVDNDFFLLVERDGSRTRFVRTDKAEKPIKEPNSAEKAINEGYEWARQNDVRNHAQCRSRWTDDDHNALQRGGCSKYVTEVNVVNKLKPIPHHESWDDGTTTAQCVAEVRAYWDPVLQDMIEQGNAQAVEAEINGSVNPALRQCNNFDNIRISHVIHEPQLRLAVILRKVKAGKSLSGRDKLTIRNDHPGVFDFPENEYRTKYLNTLEEIFSIAGGKDEVFSDKQIEDDGSANSSDEDDEDSMVIKAEKYAEQHQLNNDPDHPDVIQRNAKNKAFHERLDQMQAQGIGRAPKVKATAEPEKVEQSKEFKFVPMSKSQYRQHLDNQFDEYARQSARQNQENIERLNAGLKKMSEGCGGKLIDYPVVGMNDETFMNCTIHARHGGLADIYSETYNNVPIRLYVFDSLRAARVYMVDGVITAIVNRPGY